MDSFSEIKMHVAQADRNLLRIYDLPLNQLIWLMIHGVKEQDQTAAVSMEQKKRLFDIAGNCSIIGVF